MYKTLQVGTLLLSHADSRRQHAAIVYSNNNGDISIVHCWPDDNYNSDPSAISFDGLCNPGIKCEKLIDVLCEWQDVFTTVKGHNDLFFYFNLAIPIEDWLNEKDLNFAVLDTSEQYSDSINLYDKYTKGDDSIEDTEVVKIYKEDSMEDTQVVKIYKEDSIEDTQVLDIYNNYLNRPSQEKTLDNMKEYLKAIKQAIKDAYDEPIKP